MQVAQDAEVRLVLAGHEQQAEMVEPCQRDQSGCQFSGTIATTNSSASQNRARRRGGSGSHPAPNAKPVKKMSCQANGSKNQAPVRPPFRRQVPAEVALREVERHRGGKRQGGPDPRQRHDDGNHGQHHDIHGQDVEIVGHVGQGDQTDEALTRLGEEMLQVERLDIVDASAQPACPARPTRPR